MLRERKCAMKNKHVLNVFSLLAAVCIAAGCNGSTAETTETTGTKDAAAQATAAESENVLIPESVEFGSRSYDAQTEELTLYINNETDVSDLSLMKNLKKLSLCSAVPEKNIECLGYESIKDLSSLESLSLENVVFRNESGYDFAFLNSLQNLNDISVNLDSSVDFECLADIENLTKLTLNVDGEIDVSGIGKLKNLSELKLINKSIYDYGNVKNIGSISETEKLRSLSLYLVRFDESYGLTFDFLYEIPALEKVELGWYVLDDWTFLNGLTDIEDLTLFRCNIDNAEFVNEMSSLKNLALTNTKITNYGCLNDNYSVESLSLVENGMTGSDYDFSGISHLKKLKRLFVCEDAADKEKYDRGIAAVKSALPNCEITEY